MFELLLLLGAVVIFKAQLGRVEPSANATPAATLAPRKLSNQLAQMITYADRLYQEKKWLAAEKAYLKVLKLDHKNVTAYSHLGIIYSTQKNYADAIECFEIAVRLRPSAGTQQNLALAFYENRNFMKAIAAFDKAIMFEPSSSRYIGLSKAYKRISNTAQMISALEKAVELDDSKRVLHLLAAAYEQNGREAEGRAVYQRIYALDPYDSDAARVLGHAVPSAPAKA